MFQLDKQGVLRVDVFASLPWLVHGFGTRVSEDWPQGGEVVTLKQTHSDTTWEAREAAGCLGEGDALITNTPGLLLTIRTADCIPLLIVDPQRRAVAAVHAGWRGTVAGIAGKTVRRMVDAYGSKPEELIAAIGPGINVCCFEVGPDVAAQFGTEARHVDLIEANRKDLASVGVASIAQGAPCTVCQPGLFHSFRRDKTQGRMISAAGICVCA